MRIGDEYYCWVSLDSAGVPHGGPWGDVEWFSQELESMGLALAWSRIYSAFFLYRERFDGYCEPMMACLTWTSPPTPIPLSPAFLQYLKHDQRWFGYQTPAMLKEQAAQADRDFTYKAHRERADRLIEDRDSIMNEVEYKMGLRSRPLIFVPDKRLVGIA